MRLLCVPLGRIVVEPYDLGVDDESVLVHNWLKSVDDTFLFLGTVTYLLDGAWVNLAENRLKYLAEHSITKVTFDDDDIDVVLIGFYGKGS